MKNWHATEVVRSVLVAFLTTVPAEPLIGRGILAGD